MFIRWVFSFLLMSQALFAWTHRPEPILVSTGPAQRQLPGIIYNLDNFVHLADYFGLQLDEYGANSTVDYLVPVFPNKITTFANSLPQIVMNKNDVILIEVTTPDSEWLDTHSLFNITPYFYFYDSDGVETPVYASENITIQFFDLFGTPGEVTKICITPNKTIATQYQGMGYMVSGMPEEYLDSTTFQILFRVGTIGDIDHQLSINSFVRVTFLEATQEEPFAGSDYYDAAEIVASFPMELDPDAPDYMTNITDYNQIVSYLEMTGGFTPYQCVKYLSNIYSTDYAFNNFYKAVSVNPAAQMQANNTGENYYNSQGIPVYSQPYIDLHEFEGEFLHILSLNQNTMGAGLTSNVQIYNAQSLAIIDEGLITTAPDLPSFSSPGYPHGAPNPYPTFQINSYDVSNLIANDIHRIIITERISYNPVNYYQSSNEYEGKAYFFLGDMLTGTEIMYLEDNYDITITSHELPSS